MGPAFGSVSMATHIISGAKVTIKANAKYKVLNHHRHSSLLVPSHHCWTEAGS
jgi:hypothetical protein